jgi:hypothetical protein
MTIEDRERRKSKGVGTKKRQSAEEWHVSWRT